MKNKLAKNKAKIFTKH